MSVDGDTRDLLSRPVSEARPEDLEGLFLGAARPAGSGLVGMEVELLGFVRADLAPAPHARLAEVLADLGARRAMTPEHDLGGALVGLKGAGRSVSLEPGGQLELATRPHASLLALRDEVLGFATDLREIAAARGLGFWAMGHQPLVDRASAPHMPKARYDRMQAYLSTVGTRGLDMMHLTGSVQVALDFDGEASLVDKVRVAARASPFLSALVAASPFVRGAPGGLRSERYGIWLDTDPARCGVWPEMLDAEGLTPRRYLARAMQVPPMFFLRGGVHRAAPALPFAHFVREGFEGDDVTVTDLLDHLTTLFPEVRVKTYVELRGADCVPPAQALAIAAFWRGLLDDADARGEAGARLAALDHAAIDALRPAVARVALAAPSAAGPVAGVARWLVERAREGLGRLEPGAVSLLDPLAEQAASGRSPADLLLEEAARTSVASALRAMEL